MKLITLDFETFYDKEYSLSKMTTEAYIRDPRFEVIGVSIKVNDGKPEWFSGDDEYIRDRLVEHTAEPCAILCHNAAFDGGILSWRYNIRPAYWLDTLSMARPFNGLTTGVSLHSLSNFYGVGEKGTAVANFVGKRRLDFTETELNEYAEYCIQDNDLTYKLFKRLSPLIPQSELDLIDMTIRMFTEPVLEFDVDILTEHLREVQAKKKKFLDTIGGDEFKEVLMSNDKFAAVLKKLGVDPPMKVSKKTGKPAYAFAKTDKEFTALQNHPNLGVQAFVSARLGVKSTIEETRTQSFIGIASRGKLPIMLNYWGAHTGRYSGGDKVNLQNLPRGGKLRKAIKAPAGHKIITCDSAQIEARLLAYVAKQDDLVQAFRDKRDVYCEFGTDVFGRVITKEDRILRHIAKTGVLGLGFMCGPDRFREMLASGVAGPAVTIDESESQRIVRAYRQKNHKITSLWNVVGNALKEMAQGKSGVIVDHIPISYSGEKIYLPNGMFINYPELKSTSDGFEYKTRKLHTKIYSGKATENLIQALARMVIAEQMLKIKARYKAALQVHDEVVVVVPDEQIEEAKEFIAKTMAEPPYWALDLPLACELGVGDSYGSTKA